MEIIYSDSLRKILTAINCEISQALLDKEHSPSVNSYYDIGNRYISFLKYRSNLKGKGAKTKVKAIQTLVPGNVWTSEKRMSMKVGNFVNTILPNNRYSDNKLEDFIRNVYCHYDLENQLYTYEVVSGERIREAYNSKICYDISSCMTNRPKYLDIYVDNPDVCQLVIVKHKETGFIIARALLWTDIKGVKVLDRVYSSSAYSYTYQLVQWWAFNNNYYVRTNSKRFLSGNRVSQTFVIKVKSKLYKKYPYIDTFRCYDPLTGYLTNNPINRKVMYLDSTSGNCTDLRSAFSKIKFKAKSIINFLFFQPLHKTFFIKLNIIRIKSRIKES